MNSTPCLRQSGHGLAQVSEAHWVFTEGKELKNNDPCLKKKKKAKPEVKSPNKPRKVASLKMFFNNDGNDSLFIIYCFGQLIKLNWSDAKVVET